MEAFTARRDLEVQLEHCELAGQRMTAEAALYRVRSHLFAALTELQADNQGRAAAETAMAAEASYAPEIVDSGLDRDRLSAFRRVLQGALEWNGPGAIEDAIERTDALLWDLDGSTWRSRSN